MCALFGIIELIEQGGEELKENKAQVGRRYGGNEREIEGQEGCEGRGDEQVGRGPK